MRTEKPLLPLCGAIVALALAGCAPAIGPGLQIGVSSGPGLQLSSSPCGLGGSQSAMLSGSSRMFGFAREQIRVAQAKASLAIVDPHTQRESWRRLAAGC